MGTVHPSASLDILKKNISVLLGIKFDYVFVFHTDFQQ
jgi:hypothetical protein